MYIKSSAFAPQDELVFINISYPLGKNWVECGISAVDAFLRAMGFNYPWELFNFCKEVNVYKAFSTSDFMNDLIVGEDKLLLTSSSTHMKCEEALSKNKIAKEFYHPNPPLLSNFETYNPNQTDFMIMLFTWLTGGKNGRVKFIEWWESRNKNLQDDPNYYPSRNFYSEQVPVLKTFQALIVDFLVKFTADMKEHGYVYELSSDENPADTINKIETDLLKLFFKQSKWRYKLSSARHKVWSICRRRALLFL